MQGGSRRRASGRDGTAEEESEEESETAHESRRYSLRHYQGPILE